MAHWLFERVIKQFNHENMRDRILNRAAAAMFAICVCMLLISLLTGNNQGYFIALAGALFSALAFLM